MIMPTLDKLKELKLYGMRIALEEQLKQENIKELSFEERLSLLVEREITEQENKRLSTRLKNAHLRQNACMEHIQAQSSRGLDRTLIKTVSTCQWITKNLNILITGPCGVGKSYLACALGNNACLSGYSVRYIRIARLFGELAIGSGDGRYRRLLRALCKVQVLIIDDFGLTALAEHERKDLLEILEERHNRSSTIITSQLPLKHWHETIGNPTIADAILDRLVHNAYTIELKGESLRKQAAQKQKTE